MRDSVSALRKKNKSLSDIEWRVERMKNNVYDSSKEQSYTQQRIDSEVDMQYRSKGKMIDCKVCGRSILAALHEEHEGYCNGIAFHVGLNILHEDKMNAMVQCPMCHFVVEPEAEEQHVQKCNENKRLLSELRKREGAHRTMEYIKIKIPRSPTNLRIVPDSATCDSIQIAWDPPIFTGSAMVFDYEISYSKCNTRFANGKSMVVYHDEAVLTSSVWIMKKPIVNNSFTISGLLAKSDYGKISVRAKTIYGISPPSNEIEMVSTLDPICPTAPMYCTVGAVTDASFFVSWIEPFNMGGTVIDKYEIRFKAQAPSLVEEQLDPENQKFLPRIIAVPSDARSFTVSDLHSDSIYQDIHVIAVNVRGMKSRPSNKIDSIQTLRKGLKSKLLEQLDAAIQMKEQHIDSDFYNGFVQRYDRKYFIHLLSTTIKQSQPELSDLVDSMQPVQDVLEDAAESLDGFSDSSSEASSDYGKVPTQPLYENTDSTFEAETKNRREHFYYRINKTEDEIVDIKHNIKWCKDRKTELMGLLAGAENRLQEKQTENERVKLFKGDEIDSFVLHGRLQRFKTTALLETLAEELDIERFYVADTKRDLLEVEAYQVSDQEALKQKTYFLQERKAALDAFELEIKRQNAGRQLLQKLESSNLGNVLRAWKGACEAEKQEKRLMNMVFRRIDLSQVGSAFRKWQADTLVYKRKIAWEVDDTGIGSKELSIVKNNRTHLEMDCTELLSTIRKTHKLLENTKLTASDVAMEAKNAYVVEEREKEFMDRPEFSYWHQGDANMLAGNLSAANDCYNKQLAIIQDDKAFYAERGRLYSCIGKVLFEMGNYDNASLYLQKAIVISDQLTDRIGESMATSGFADLQLAQRDLIAATDSFERALCAFEDLCDIRGQIKCFRGLQEISRISECKEKEQEYENRAHKLQCATAAKLDIIDKKIDGMRQQLLSVSAKASQSMDIERVGPNVPKLRIQRIKLLRDLEENKQSRDAFLLLLKDKTLLFEEGQRDLENAVSTDATTVDTRIITGSIARYSVEEFQSKIGKLLGMLKFAQEQSEKERATLDVRISNNEEEIKELEIELAVETGALMRKVMSKKMFRVAAFNEGNRKCNTVMGSEAGGSLSGVTTFDDCIILYELSTGVCSHHIVGEKACPSRPFEARRGHRKAISCIDYNGDRLYTGGLDAGVGVWQVRHDEVKLLQFLYEDFDDSITSIAGGDFYFVVGTSDGHIYCFCKDTQRLLSTSRNAHSKSVSNLFCNGKEFASCGIDGDVRTWLVHAPSNGQSTEVKPILPRKRRAAIAARPITHYSIISVGTFRAQRDKSHCFDGHTASVTCLQFEGFELVSGDRDGIIIVWTLKTQRPIRITKVHNGAVTCLQFDATRIVSGGMDNIICVSDLLTGQVTQRLKGHDARILQVQFDRQVLLSYASNGNLRHWTWQGREESKATNNSITHLIEPGETLRSISALYKVNGADILKWNHLRNVADLYPGQRLTILTNTALTSKSNASNISIIYGNLLHEQVHFVSGPKSKLKSKDEILQDRKKQSLAKKYFPSLLEEDSSESSAENSTSSSDSSSDSESNSSDSDSSDEN